MKNTVSMYSIAEHLGMSVSEVSRAFKADYKMNPEKREKILQTAQQMGYTRNEGASRLSQKPVTIGIITGREPQYFTNELLSGFSRAEGQLSAYKLVCLYETVNTYPYRDGSGAKIEAAIERCLARGADGIVISAFDRDLPALMDRFRARGVRMAAVNFDLPGHLDFASVNNTDAAAAMAAYLLSLPKTNGNTLIFSGSLEYWTHGHLVARFRETAARYGLTVRHMEEALTEETLEEACKTAFAACPDAQCIYLTSGICVPVLEYVRRNAPGRVKIVASDLYDRMIPYLLDGTLTAVIYQNPQAQAYEALCGMYALCTGHPAPAAQIFSKPEIITRENYTLYL
ncbi:MAG: LacI family DNA-binding transcriptional regulator [Clostridia bacterium]|nr:LacI family DNA-binding transcriptional regulator [Clostridia bacterium]